MVGYLKTLYVIEIYQLKIHSLSRCELFSSGNGMFVGYDIQFLHYFLQNVDGRLYAGGKPLSSDIRIKTLQCNHGRDWYLDSL